MKRLFTILTTLALLCVVGCEEQGDDNVNPNDKPNTEQPSDKPNDGGNENEQPDDAYIALTKEIISFAPDGGSVDIMVYSNYAWELSNTCNWVTTSISGGEASEAGTTVTLTTELTYDDREGIILFSCGKVKKPLVISQSLKEVIIADENNTFNVPAEGGNVIINYQTTIECEVIIPEEAKSWISLAPATRALVNESATLTVAENTTYSARSAVVKVVKVGDNTLFAEYTINQEQNDAIVADENNTFNVPAEGGVVEVAYQTNVECKVVIPEEAQSWISIAPATRALVNESATLTVAENTTYSARSAVIKVVKVDDNTLFAEYTINQVQNDAIVADENNILEVPAEGGVVEVAYQTNVECKVVIPEEAKSWISIAPATRALVNESATLTVAENTTYSERSAVVKVVKVGDNTLFAEYTINQMQNDAIIADGNNTFNLKGWAQSINIAYKTNVECEVVIPEEAQSWISLAPATRALGDESATLNIAENNTGAERSTVVKVVATNNNELVAEYTITQNQRYFMEYTSADGYTVTPSDSSAFDATILRNKYIDGKGYIDFDAPITSIGEEAFERSSLKSITIPDSVTSIGEAAFSGCTSLKSFYGKYASEDGRCLIVDGTLNSFAPAGITEYTIPDSVTSIGSYAFNDCDSLTSVTIGNGVTSIGHRAFYGCSSLTSVYCKATTPPAGDEYMFTNNASGRTIYVPTESVEAYKAAEGWSEYADAFVPYDFEKGEVDMKYRTICYTSTDGNAVTPYATNVFGANIVSNTYKDGQGIIIFNGDVTSIGVSAFLGCTSLASIIIPDSVTSIGYGAFLGCTSLASITIPDSVTSIGGSAFAGCTSLTSVAIPESVTEIGYEAFYSCTSLTSITIPDSVTSIGYEAFYNCTSLTSVTIPDGVTKIGEDAFSGCTSLTSITIPDSVTSIGSFAFYGCTSLTSITIPDSVTSIGISAFRDCTSLTSVYCKATTPPTGGNYMFSYINGGYMPIGCTIYVPTESVDAYKAAEGWSDYADYIVGYDFE